MTEQNTQLPRISTGPRFDLWSFGALLIALLVLLPILSIFWIAAHPTEPIWEHLIHSTLPRYLGNSLIIMFSVGALSAAIGTGAAWLIVCYRFPGARWLQWLLLLPLAVPGYLGAYALVDFLEYAGPVQTGLRTTFGWDTSRDYYFPEIRSRAGAIFVLTASLYPYVYLLARAGFREQSGRAHEVARALGAGAYRRFFGIGLPLAQPAIAAGTAIVMMETVNDFGAVDFFGVQTLTTGIFTVWLEAGNAGGAAQIACVILAVILFLVMLEKFSRRRVRFHRMSRSDSRIAPGALKGGAGWLATAVCTLPVLAGFVLPVSVLGHHALTRSEGWMAPGLLKAFVNTFVVGSAAALLTVSAALFLVYATRLSGKRAPRLLLPFTTIGYAAPGAVLALGLLIPLAAFDNGMADMVLALTGFDPGLLLTGSAAVLVYAYAVRFFAIGQGAADAAVQRVSPSLPMAARTLGHSAGGTLLHVYLPLIRGSIATALLLVFVDAVKELPATLLLRPFNFNTLATRAHESASLEKIVEAAPSALLIIFVSLAAVALLARQMIRSL
ncbi:iron ABC transporter permease [Rhodobacteraceae bacterium]|nr:iron ABC transporter permease [Paracoccaceae bacterium]